MSTQAAALTERQIAAILALRHARAQAFGAELFADPAWDILLQLFAAKLGRRRMRLADLDVVSPASTLARWALVLQERGLVTCELDCSEPNDFWLEISAVGAAKMSRLFEDLPRQLVPEPFPELLVPR